MTGLFEDRADRCSVVEHTGLAEWVRRARWRGSSLGLRRELLATETRLSAPRPSLVVCETVVGTGYAVAALRLGVPVVILVRDRPQVIARFWSAYRLARTVGRARFIANSRATAAILRDLAGRDVATVVPPPVDLGAVRAHRRDDLEMGSPILVLGVGRISRAKGVDLWLTAIAAARMAGSDTRGVWIGDGNQRWAVRLAEKLALTESVVFAGSVDNPYQLMASADVLLVPSRAEAFSRVIVEGMALGLPIVATDVGGIPEALGTVGVLVPSGDVASMAKAILRLDQEVVQRARREGPDRAERFSAERYRERLAPHLAL